MDLIGEEEGRLTRLARWLEASRAELLGLLVLCAGSLAAAGALWWQAAAPGGVDDLGDAGAVAAPESGGHGPAARPPASADPAEPVAGSEDAGDPPAATGEGDAGEPQRLTVHVAGAVVEPGVVELPAGARVGEAVAAAGGATDDAEPERLNLARALTDGEQVHVPREGEEAPDPPAGAPSGSEGDEAPIDLNRAEVAQLEELPGIGPTRARAIVEHREQHGPFGEPGELRDVPGIGEVTFQRLADRVTVS